MEFCKTYDHCEFEGFYLKEILDSSGVESSSTFVLSEKITLKKKELQKFNQELQIAKRWLAKKGYRGTSIKMKNYGWHPVEPSNLLIWLLPNTHEKVYSL